MPLLSWSACARPSLSATRWHSDGALWGQGLPVRPTPSHPDPGAAGGAGFLISSFGVPSVGDRAQISPWRCFCPKNNGVPASEGAFPHRRTNQLLPFPEVEKPPFSHCSVGEAPGILGAFPASLRFQFTLRWVWEAITLFQHWAGVFPSLISTAI